MNESTTTKAPRKLTLNADYVTLAALFIGVYGVWAGKAADVTALMTILIVAYATSIERRLKEK